MDTIQIIAIAASSVFLGFIGFLIVRGKLREEYAIVWVVSTLGLIGFSFWRDGLDLIAKKFGVHDPPNLLFVGAIFAILVYLLHLSVVVSKLQAQQKILAQEIALLREKEKKQEKNS